MMSKISADPPIFKPTAPDALVCVVDDDKAVRECLERLFRSAGFKAESFTSATDYMKRSEHDGPVCVVLDVNMPEMDGFGLQQALAGRCEEIVFLTGHGDVPMCAKGMKAGAADFLTKPVDDVVLLDAVLRALDRACLHRKNNASQAAARRLLRSLTTREFQVMQRVTTGMLNKQIAADLGIAEKTVKIHRGRVMHKTGCVSVPDLMRLIDRAGDISHQPPAP